MLGNANSDPLSFPMTTDMSLCVIEDWADPNAENAVLDRLTLQETLQRIDRLPEAQRITITLVCIDGHTYGEAAKLLDVAIGTIMSRVFAARANLRSM